MIRKWHERIDNNKQKIEAKYMVATKAFHKLGNISRKKPDLCIIQHETPECYIGHWMTGFGMMSVQFPKETTHEPTEEDKQKWEGSLIQINNNPPHHKITFEN